MEHQYLTKLTVPQLKALCKERNLTGYSKLNKPALLQKLSVDAPAPLCQPAASASISKVRENEVAQKNAAPSKVTSNRNPHSNAVASSRPGLGTATAVMQRVAPSRVLLQIPAAMPASLALEVRPEQRLPQETAPHRLDICSLNSFNETTLSAAHSVRIDKVGVGFSAELLQSPIPQDHSKKRKRIPDSAAPDASIKTKTARQVMPTLSTPKDREHRIVTKTAGKSGILPGPDFRKSPSLAAVRPLDTAPAIQGHRYASSSTHTGSRDKKSAILTMAGVRPGALPATKQFSALVPKKPAVVPCLAVALPETRTQRSRHAHWDNHWLVTCSHLEFLPYTIVPKLDPITFPPKISQRKKVANLSLVISLLDAGSVASLSKLSRVFRYSAYTSASHSLRENYTGKRLELVLAAHPPTTNFWPYFHQRAEEKKNRRAIFDKSYLGLVFASSPEIISSQLWTSPDNEKQITMAIRFLTTLHYFHVSIGYDPDRQFMRRSVVSADEVVKDGIWKIGVAHLVDNVIDYYYVVEATCEVVGRAETSHTDISEHTTRQSLPLRADWAAYIEVFHSSGSSCEVSARGLEQFLRWSNYEEYTHGISRLWALKVENEGKVGEYKRVVAARYVMACVVGNSFSGRAMTSSEMEKTFKGVPVVGRVVSSKPNGTARGMPHLYLPECHLVESVHLTSQDGKNLHPALAVVQTPAREYYILKDNGMQIGCEEDGVPHVWQEILGCNFRGVGVDAWALFDT